MNEKRGHLEADFREKAVKFSFGARDALDPRTAMGGHYLAHQLAEVVKIFRIGPIDADRPAPALAQS